MNVTVENKGSKSSKLTVTADGTVRIKVGENIKTDYEEVVLTTRLKNLADVIIKSGLNTVTLRGQTLSKCPDSIQMSCSNKNKEKRFRKNFSLV